MKKYTFILYGILIICLTGCKGDKKPSMDQVRVVQFTTSDGVKIYADYYHPPKPSPVVILLHMYGHNRKTWGTFAPDLFKAGFAVLALDIRGHGQSIMQNGKRIYLKYPKRGEKNMFLDSWKDVKAAIKYLKKYPFCKTDDVVIVGASIGCSIALNAGVKLPQIKGAVLMSPGTNYVRINSVEDIKRFAPRPLLMISDKKEEPACIALYKAGGYDASIDKTFYGVGHGTNMFASPSDKKIRKLIINWLKKNFL